MKKTLALLFVLLTLSAWSQKIVKPSAGKAVVYFIRSSDGAPVINFKYFDGDKYIGKFSAGSYMLYECEPGKHLFWSKAENTDYVEADLEAGKIYIIDAEPQLGLIKAGVKLIPFDDNVNNYKSEKKYRNKRENMFSAILDANRYIPAPKEIIDGQAEWSFLITDTKQKYDEKKAKGEAFTQLPGAMFYRL
ncbi:MAG: hypothetical protein EOO48_00890 [Flavobacterium sp.]|nr:MAG: hypothetical protein EOO48_00890 [Flavobacterium sp.]